MIELAEYIPNDDQFVAQWPLTDSSAGSINATLAWDQTTGNANTIVAVMDTGIDYTHPDLYLAIAINNGEIPDSLLNLVMDTNANGQIDFYDLNSLDAYGNFVLDSDGNKVNDTLANDQNGNGYIDAGDLLVAPWVDGLDNDGNGYIDDLVGWDFESNDNNPKDTHGHGTHVAGIIAALGNNGIGIAGINWRIQVIVERFHNGSGGQVSNMIQAIDHAVALGAKVISASWGTREDNPALHDAIQWAGDNGVVFVSAAGNYADNMDIQSNAYYPAAYIDLPNLIGVASVDPDGTLSSFSNYGQTTVEIAAPGGNILSTQINGGYVLWSGTSMAVPHVAGVASLLAGLFPDRSADWIVNRILSTAKPLPDLADKTISGGALDAFEAINTTNLAGPRVLLATPVGDVDTSTDRISLTFDHIIDTSTFSGADITFFGPEGSITPTNVNRLTDYEYELLFPLQTSLGQYILKVGPDISDDLDRTMDQDRDGITGEPQEDRFELVFQQSTPSTVQIIDDLGADGFTAASDWTLYSGAGFLGDFLYKSVGNGNSPATWTFTDLTPGQYIVSATWQAHTNRVVDASYTILDGATQLATIQVDQQQTPADFFEAEWWQDLGAAVNLTGSTLVVQLSDLASPAENKLIADAIRIERIGDLPSGPEIQVTVNGSDVADGTSLLDFGSTTLATPVSQIITVDNVGTTDLTLGVITLPAGYSLVTDFGATTLGAGQSTTFVVQLDADAAGTYAGTISFDSNDGNESPFDISVTGSVTDGTQPAEPEIEVLAGGEAIADGTGSIDFGSTVTGVPVSTVQNNGTADLTLGTITLPAGYSLVTGFGATTLSAGQGTTFEVQLDALTTGDYNDTISFASNDADENPFDFSVAGSVSSGSTAQVSIIDDGEAGFSAASGWNYYSGVGLQGDFMYRQVGDGSAPATWTFTGLAPGQYIVSATWQAYTNRVVDASYTILDGATQLATIQVDQQQTPADFFESEWWQELGAAVNLTGSTLVVQLSDLASPAGNYLVADAIRIERIGDLP